MPAKAAIAWRIRPVPIDATLLHAPVPESYSSAVASCELPDPVYPPTTKIRGGSAHCVGALRLQLPSAWHVRLASPSGTSEASSQVYVATLPNASASLNAIVAPVSACSDGHAMMRRQTSISVVPQLPAPPQTWSRLPPYVQLVGFAFP